VDVQAVATAVPGAARALVGRGAGRRGIDVGVGARRTTAATATHEDGRTQPFREEIEQALTGSRLSSSLFGILVCGTAGKEIQRKGVDLGRSEEATMRLPTTVPTGPSPRPRGGGEIGTAPRVTAPITVTEMGTLVGQEG